METERAKAYSIDISPQPGTKLTGDQIDIAKMLIEYAESQGCRVDKIVFAPNSQEVF